MNWTPGMKLAGIEKEVIKKALEFYRGNKTHTADSLGISVKTLYNKLEEYEKQDAAKKYEQEQREKTRAAAEKAYRAPSPFAQPLTPPSQELTVSVPERNQVQALLPKQAAAIPAERHNRRAKK